MIRDVSQVAEELGSMRWPFPPGDLFIAHLEKLRPKMLELARAAKPIPVSSILLKSPVANPGKFICGAGNVPEVLEAGGHPRKLGLPFKMPSANGGASDGVTLRWPERDVRRHWSMDGDGRRNSGSVEIELLSESQPRSTPLRFGGLFGAGCAASHRARGVDHDAASGRCDLFRHPAAHRGAGEAGRRHARASGWDRRDDGTRSWQTGPQDARVTARSWGDRRTTNRLRLSCSSDPSEPHRFPKAKYRCRRNPGCCRSCAAHGRDDRAAWHSS